jgi:ribose transport system permease protein/putative xylitol transport system permease protein
MSTTNDIPVAEIATPVPDAPPPRGRASRARSMALPLLPVTVLPILVLVFALCDARFVSVTNLGVMLTQAGPLLTISLGATLVVLMGSIDLSVGAVAALSAATSAVLIQDHGWGTKGLVAAVFVGMAAGGINALCVTALRLPSFIVTLGTMSIFGGLTLHLLDGKAMFVDELPLGWLATGEWISNVPNIFIVALMAWAVGVVINRYTRFGRYLTAIGAGEPVAALSGVPVTRNKALAFIVSGAFAGVGGAFLLLQLGSATPSLGDGFLLDSIAAIVIGGTALSGGVGGVSRTLLGVALLTVLSNGLNVTGVSVFTQDILKGVVVILAVLMTIDRGRMQGLVK